MKGYFLLLMLVAFFSINLRADDNLSESDWQKAVGKKDYTETYREIEPKEDKKKEASVPKNFNVGSIKTVVIVLIVAILIVLLIVLINYLLKIKTTHKVSNNFKVEEIDDPDQFKLSDLEQYLIEALEAGNYRLAVRIQFLMLIKALKENDYINWKKEKTNWDYLQEVKEFSFHADFKYLIKVFEKVWYANYSIKRDTYDQVALKFVEIPKILSSER